MQHIYAAKKACFQRPNFAANYSIMTTDGLRCLEQ
jgi:hypothetical protein